MLPGSRKPSEVRRRRIAPLATLPLFFPLEGRDVLLIGGSAAAAWKAELLLAAGAEVMLLAEDLSAEMVELKLSDCRLHYEQRPWRAEDLSGKALVVGDPCSETEAEAIAAAARVAGVPCNLIDHPQHCSFTFGSIVNRSPVVVGISTAGAAPVLGQAIRRRIETLLPAALADWAGRAAAIRRTVARGLADATTRRLFWQRFADLAMSGVAVETADLTADTAFGTEGHVTLVGAGPGDAELLTLKAVRALQSADVILFDALVSDEVLDLARREARRLLVGKRGGRPSCRQDEINDLMVKLARQGKHVVRLKSGDPMIFGRAGEEIARLRAAGIPVDVVPGITAGLAAASALGVSLTHRRHAHSVRFVTGHSRDGGLPDDLDWRGLADPETTLMIYMGGRTAGELSGRLIAQGLPAGTPAAVVAAVGRPEQAVARCSLRDLASAVSIAGDEPVLIGVGAVFRQVEQNATACPLEASAV